MATNFKISVHRNGENLHLKLRGDFDGTSAHDLLTALNKYTNQSTVRVFIHTSCLSMLYPFGLYVFHCNFSSIKGKSLELVFTGEHASRLAAEKHGPSGLIITAAPPVDDYHRTDSASESGRAG
jgi:anti-anti-sigma regulatory factor